MYKYGQYCPVAMATEILGDRWTLLIVRDLLAGSSHFNELERGLPGISRGLLAERLRRLHRLNILEKLPHGKGRRTEYRLTEAGRDLQHVVNALLIWGAKWAFAEPTEEQLDPILLLWWLKGRVHQDRLPEGQVVIQFDFHHDRRETYWLLLKREDVSICLSHPGFDVDVLVTCDLSIFLQLWLGRISYPEALARHGLKLEAIPAYIRAFPRWFAWSLAAPAVRAAAAERQVASTRIA